MGDEHTDLSRPPVRGSSLRGFARLPRDVRRQLAAAGGAKAHANRTAHRWTADEARVAGRKGGLLRAARDRQRRQDV